MVLEKFDFGNFWTFGILETKNIFVFFSKSTKIVKLLILGQICFTVHVITTKILIRDQSRSDSGHPRPRIRTKYFTKITVFRLMCVTMFCWWVFDGDNFIMLVTNDNVGDFFRDVNDFSNVNNRLSTSSFGHQHLKIVTNIPHQHRFSHPDDLHFVRTYLSISSNKISFHQEE